MHQRNKVSNVISTSTGLNVPVTIFGAICMNDQAKAEAYLGKQNK